MNTDGGTVTLVASLASATVTPPAGAGTDSVTGNAVVWPTATVAAGTLIAAGAVTVTLAVALVTPVALAVIVADPAPIAVIGTVMLVVLTAKVTETGAVATVEFVLARPTVRLLAGAVDNVSVRFC